MRKLFQVQFLNLARDGVAANTQFLRCFNAPATGIEQRGLDQLLFKSATHDIPHIGAAAGQQRLRFYFEIFLPA